MDLLENPFYVLGASPRDDRKRIMELADEGALQLDPQQCSEARSTLTMPRKRIKAELAWMPVLAPNRSSAVIAMVHNDPARLLELENVTPLARCNLIAAGLSRVRITNSNAVSNWILCLCRSYENVRASEILDLINEERVAAGFSKEADVSVVDAELSERKVHYRQVMKSALDQLAPQALVVGITDAVEKATNVGDVQGPKLLNDLIDAYEAEARDFLEKEEGNIEVLVDRIFDALAADVSEQKLSEMIEYLCKAVKNWDFVAQPIQVSRKSCGMSHDESERVAGLVRKLAIEIFNEYGELEFAKKITETLNEAFNEVLRIAELTANDADTLEEIERERRRVDEEAEREEKEWREQISYEAEVGVIFKNTLRISPEGVVWKGQKIPLEDIIYTRWGGINHSVNGISSGSTFTIWIFSKTQKIKIELKDKKIYAAFIDCLWRAVGVKLLTELLVDLRNGKERRFGAVLITDTGVKLKKQGWLSGGDSQFCRWSELEIVSHNGYFCITNRNDKKLSACLSYLESNNVHVLEAAMRILWRKGAPRMSDVLE